MPNTKATTDILATTHASTTNAVIINKIKDGNSISPSRGIKLLIILDLFASLIFPAITKKTKQSATNKNGKGTTSPGAGIHFVLSLFKTSSPVHSL